MRTYKIIALPLFFTMLMFTSCKKQLGKKAENSNGSGAGTEGGTVENAIKIGTFKVRVYKPTGTCSSNSSWGMGWAFGGVMGGQIYDAKGNPHGTYYPVNSGGDGMISNNSPATYADYTIAGANKITWELWPNRSSFPTACMRKGESTIDFSGQVKEVVINW